MLTAEGDGVRLVGGCVRDALLGREVKDIDVATTAPPEKVMRLLKAGGIKALPTGLAHGTVTAIIEHHPVEITTLRVDVETYGRHAKVAFTDDWAADASRRDFTMNALYADLDGHVFDPVGGLDDARAGHVRFVGDADKRIEEDGLRSLRFFRFHAWYGNGAPDADGMRACRRHRHMIANLSGERIQHELLRLLGAPDPLPALRAMRAATVLSAALPAKVSLDRLSRLVAAERAYGDADAIRRLSAILPADRDARQAVAERLRLSRKAGQRLISLIPRAPVVAASTGIEALRRGVHRVGQAEMIDRALLAGQPQQARRIIGIELPAFPLKGHDAHALGAAGPRVGEVLDAVRGWWAARDFQPDRAACLAELARRV